MQIGKGFLLDGGLVCPCLTYPKNRTRLLLKQKQTWLWCHLGKRMALDATNQFLFKPSFLWIFIPLIAAHKNPMVCFLQSVPSIMNKHLVSIYFFTCPFRVLIVEFVPFLSPKSLPIFTACSGGSGMLSSTMLNDNAAQQHKVPGASGYCGAALCVGHFWEGS